MVSVWMFVPLNCRRKDLLRFTGVFPFHKVGQVNSSVKTLDMLSLSVYLMPSS